MRPGLVKRLCELDGALARSANDVARGSKQFNRATRLMAERLATVEIGLMGALLFAGRHGSVARMLAAVSTVYVAVEALGVLWPRPRPFEDVADIRPLVQHSTGRSFPSRHVASGLAMALVGYRAHPLLGASMTCVAMLLGASRIAAGLHYPSDVAAGIVLGGLVGRLAATHSRRSG